MMTATTSSLLRLLFRLRGDCHGDGAVVQVIAQFWSASSVLRVASASPQYTVVTHEANIEQIVKAVKFKDDLVAAEELLSAFHLVDLSGPA